MEDTVNRQYTQLYNSSLLAMIQDGHTIRFREGWRLNEILRDERGDWVLRWDKKIEE